MHRARQNAKYITCDIIAAMLTWVLFYSYRKFCIEGWDPNGDLSGCYTSRFYIALAVMPICWIFLHMLCGYYNRPFRKSRLHELAQTLLATFIGVTTIFFTQLLDDHVTSYRQYYSMFGTLFATQFALTYIPRLTITSLTSRKLRKHKISFNTLIIGSNKKAMQLFNNVRKHKFATCLRFVGFVYIRQKSYYMLERYIPNLGSTDDLEDIVRRHDIEEVVIALESNEHNRIKGIVDKLYNTNVAIKAIPDMYDILTGKVRMTAIFGIPLIEINRNIMPLWQVVVKRLLDILLSLVAMILLLPLCLIIGVGVKLSSHGPIFYKQERIGKNGVPFKIYKFRSMFADAEKDGPALSCKDDVRVTHFGRFLRKSRLDEIPNFINVLKGEMSLVGPRPERRYYIDKIVAKAPHYMHLLSVRPGITSWGQVKYGYAENVEQMIQRLKYDLIYIENRSLFVDVKIMIYTIKIIFQGKGL